MVSYAAGASQEGLDLLEPGKLVSGRSYLIDCREDAQRQVRVRKVVDPSPAVMDDITLKTSLAQCNDGEERKQYRSSGIPHSTPDQTANEGGGGTCAASS